MKRSHHLILKLLAFLAVPVVVVFWAYWSDSAAEARSVEISNHIKAVIRGEEPWHAGKAPGEIIRYIENLDGGAFLQFLTLPVIKLVQPLIERPVPEEPLPDLGKGATTKVRFVAPTSSHVRQVSTPEQLQNAIYEATPGDVIELLPGIYRLNNHVVTHRAGTNERPIVVSGRDSAKAVVEFATEEGFLVNRPHWVFQNLAIKGVCQTDSQCEHAFHIVGKAQGTIIRNNRIEDFNAHIKINGVDEEWPDDGVIEYNTLTNNHPRKTDRPVTLIDLVGANRWLVADNIISNFIKSGQDKISYGIFMKGGGKQGRIERNLVQCSTSDISQPGVRVGISFGGGGTGHEFCRDKTCKAEFFNSIVANNIVAHCNDFGIDVFRSGMISVAHNTLINTAGIDVRESSSKAHLYGNLLEGIIRSRNGAKIKEEMNEIAGLSEVFQGADRLDLRWRTQPGKIPSLPLIPQDFCKASRPDGTLPGASEKEFHCKTGLSG